MLTMALWKNADGILIANSSGILINCDTCPCEDPAPTTCPCTTWPPSTWPCEGLLQVYSASGEIQSEAVGGFDRIRFTGIELTASPSTACLWTISNAAVEQWDESNQEWVPATRKLYLRLLTPPSFTPARWAVDTPTGTAMGFFKFTGSNPIGVFNEPVLPTTSGSVTIS
jgi:hypothetical protein